MGKCSTKVRKAKWYRKHRKEILAKRKEYYATHDMTDYYRDYYEKNKEVLKERRKEQYEKHKEKRLEYAREYYQKHKYEIKKKRMGFANDEYGTNKSVNREYEELDLGCVSSI